MFGGKSFIFAKLYFRLFNKSSGERSTFRFRKTFLFYFRSGDSNELFLHNRVIQSLVDNNILRFSGNSFFAEMHLDNAAGRLAFTEPGNLHLVGDTGYCLLKPLDHNFSRYINGKLYLVLIQCFCFYVHKKYSSLYR